jgi:Arc/MetJ-type ribon-helix-helix transcriptional regulator
MKNVTVTLPEEVARWARVQAAQREKSVSRYLADLLQEQMEEETAYEAAMVGYLKREPVRLSSGGPYPSRDELHDR